MNPPADILIVDDTPANLQLLGGMLRDQGYRVRPVLSGGLALRAARHEPPDLVLLDINMPEMNGYEVCLALKADPLLAEIPVIFISANIDTADKVKAFSVGGVDYVTRPVQLEEVSARVATHVELRRQRRALRESYDRLAELEKLRDSLVHMAVHDLRSPLAALCGFLELLRNDTVELLPAESQGDLEHALTAARRMIGLVSAILDVNKLEAGKLAPVLSECDLVALAGEVVRGLGALVGDRALSLHHGPETVTARVDRELLSRVLQNLLANALKFTPASGAIRIALESRADSVRVSVADTGPGIPAAYREKIFEKFGQIEGRDRGRQFSSTGLGLTFCKLAVEAHGGRIGVDSDDGRGSTFWFVVPREPARQDAAP